MKEQKPAAAAPEGESLQDKIARLEAELTIERTARSDAEDAQARQLAQIQSQAIQMSSIREVPAGTVERELLDREGNVRTKRVAVLEPDGTQRIDDHGRKMWESVPMTETVDVFWYKIELPASGGMYVSVNGQQLYHGETYKFTLDSLRTVKELVFRAWQHEKAISGDNENAYRQQQNLRVTPRRAA